MSKLYPPSIGGTLPAFYGDQLIVPFSMNRAVSSNEVVGFAIKIKTVNDNTLIYSAEEFLNYNLTYNYQVVFQNKNFQDLFLVGEFYKVQIAYIGQEVSGTTIHNEVGYFSTIGIVKYTTKPQVTIAGLDSTNLNTHNYYYEGVYSQTDADGQYLDTTEKMYSSCFTLYDAKGKVIATSGEIVHDTSKDTQRYESTESYKFGSDLTLDESFYLVYTVTTTNGLSESSPKYRIGQRRSIPMALEVDFVATLDLENGAVRLNMKSSEFQLGSGDFVITRACNKDGYVWDDFKYFSLASEQPDKKYFMDYTVEQGVTYKYALQQYNINGIYSEKKISNEIWVDFEDSFLYDGEKQLRIRFNPKVSTFKNDLAEQKIETIGSQYPFIFRNGKIKYKEFNISGLISYHMDTVETFGSLDNIGITTDITSIYSNQATTNLVSYNVAAERQFKLDVLEWLTNGEPKIFRSPTEGNYLVRLMNVSLSPNDTLGRLLHTFTCTAYEIADFNYTNLSRYNIISVAGDPLTVMQWVTVDLKEKNKNASEEIGEWVQVNKNSAYHISFTEMVPGSSFGLANENGVVEEYIVGATGSYLVNVDSPITGIYIKKSVLMQGFLTYGYKTRAANTFEAVSSMESADFPCVQFIGNKVLNYTFSKQKNLLDLLGDVRTSILRLYFVRFQKRELKTIYVKKSSTSENAFINQNIRIFYKDGEGNNSVLIDELLEDNYSLYEIRYCREPNTITINGELYYIDKNNEVFRPKTGYLLDCAAGRILQKHDNLFSVLINDEEVSIEESEELVLPSDFEPSFINFGAGVICELGYQSQIVVYNFEETDEGLYAAKVAYKQALSSYLSSRQRINTTDEAAQARYENKMKEDYAAIQPKYTKYLQELSEAIDAYNRENGVK